MVPKYWVQRLLTSDGMGFLKKMFWDVGDFCSYEKVESNYTKRKRGNLCRSPRCQGHLMTYYGQSSAETMTSRFTILDETAH